jgi:oligoendopeptidase F
MHRATVIIATGALVLTTLTAANALAASSSTEEPMATESAAHRWDLTDIYPSNEAWSAARRDLASDLEQLQACEGTLGDSAAQLAGCLQTFSELSQQLIRLSSYASMLSDENTRDPKALEMRQMATSLETTFAQASSFLEPEILAIGRDRISTLLAASPALADYQHFLDNILRLKPHTLDADGERLVATAGLMASAPSSIYGILANADMPWPTITLSDGSEARLDQAGYSRWRAVHNRADRKKVYEEFWSTWHDYRRTFGVALYSQLQRDQFYAQARSYPSCLAAALADNKIPEKVYHTLVASTNRHLPTLHRYLKLRARMLGIEDLRYHDLYPPLVTSDLSFPIATGKAAVLESLTPLGSEYIDVVRHGFEDRWMDVFPRPGKRAGAYSNGSIYDLHPYVLLNYNDDYESVSTLAHEWGHAMHSHLANSVQPYPNADYSIFVAEVASTFNEALLLDSVLANASSDTERLYYLGSALEGLRTTFFRQAMFAEFELEVHQLVERGEALTGDRFSEIYGELLRRYHGEAEGVVAIDDLYTMEWAYIPHFYYNFYVYQYATSLAAASLFAEQVLEGEDGAADRFLGVLEAGGAEYPYELLRDAGVDLATDAPYDALAARMNAIMDQIEAILERQG